jgi:hypothetical protein
MYPSPVVLPDDGRFAEVATEPLIVTPVPG